MQRKARRKGRTISSALLLFLAWVAAVGQAYAAPLDRALSRSVTRAENTGERLALSLSAVAAAWMWIGLSVLLYVAVVVAAAVADWHMLTLLRQGVRELALFVLRGARTFLATFRDRQTPHRARLVVLMGLVYWLLPIDAVPDEHIPWGFVDDVLIAVGCSRAFMHLCPDGVIARHATSVQQAAES